MEASHLDAVTAIAAEQHGALSAAQVEGAGWSRQTLRTALANGWLSRAGPRVFTVNGSPATIEQRQTVLLLCLGPTAALSHDAAARLHRFDRCRPDVVEATLPRSSRGRDVPFTVHTTKVFGPVDVITVEGFRCTSATRTVIDLARLRIPTVRLEAAIDSAVRSGASSPIVIAARLAAIRGHGRWGAPLLDELLIDAGGHTLLERRFLTLMRRAGLPRPRPQVVHRLGARTFARVDFEFVDHGIVVEVSGRRGHVSDAERAKDAQRRNELQDIGRRVYEYTWHDVTRRPEHVTRTMKARLAA